MAPQPCVFSNADILDEIFEWFDYEHIHGHSLVDTITHTGYDTSMDVEIARRRSLASAARVCKAFQEPALRILWRQLESLMPFFILLPSFKKVQENVEQPFGWTSRDIFHLPDHLSAYEWERLSKYASYVRILYLSGPPALKSQDLTPESWTSMKVLFGDRPIFPSLRVLQWGAEWPDTELPGIAHFLSPTVDLVLLSCCTHPHQRFLEYGPRWQALLPHTIKTICERATSLSHLTTCMGQLNASELITTLSLYHPPNFRGLTLYGQYETPPLSLSSFMDLARIVGLERLTIKVPVDCSSGALLPPALDFPSLRHLRIPIHRENCPAYDIIASPRLQSLHIHHMEYSSVAYLRRVCSAWVHSFPNLEVLSFWLTPTESQDGVPTRSLLTAISPLLNLRHIRTFILQTVSTPLTIDDADLTVLSEAWPSLEELYVSGMSTPDYRAGSTAGLPGLLSLATNCSNLTMLGINCIVIRPEDASLLPASPVNHPLKELRVIRGIAPDTYRLVRENIFPHINLQLYGGDGEDGSYYA
ncbi:hypothetical protein C8Q70DRAFT_935681 [Cubamyces menziesii]|uniref:F-box domain-containing protein n=1 Tax=Trametes cubensis TaxID=1111947 RepID=A0AAD7TU90_9APHY|nr:hypothetical protein C8Q70DRAFT_935681 [Cubamyces menziesii]KAJ8482408.1 hypothetical protein ONZ51_g5371 [Trametes cubensis]